MTDETTIGIDLGDRKSQICVLSGDGEVLERSEVPTTMGAMQRRFKRCEPLRIAIEAGGQSCWVSELLTKLGHDVVVANPRKLRMVYENESKSDAREPRIEDDQRCGGAGVRSQALIYLAHARQ